MKVLVDSRRVLLLMADREGNLSLCRHGFNYFRPANGSLQAALTVDTLTTPVSLLFLSVRLATMAATVTRLAAPVAALLALRRLLLGLRQDRPQVKAHLRRRHQRTVMAAAIASVVAGRNSAMNQIAKLAKLILSRCLPA